MKMMIGVLFGMIEFVGAVVGTVDTVVGTTAAGHPPTFLYHQQQSSSQGMVWSVSASKTMSVTVLLLK